MIPAPDTIPVNWWWFEILLMATFFIHLLLMNSLLGSSLIGAYNHLKNRQSYPEASTIPTLVALTVNFGVPPLLFIQVLYGQFFYSSSIMVAVPWLLVIPFLIVAYYAAYIFVYKRGVSAAFAGVSLIVSAVLLLFIAFMMTSNMTLMLTPDTWKLYFERADGAGFNTGEATLIPRYLHFIIASIAVGGLWKAVFNRFARKGSPDQVNVGLKIVAVATMIQILDGFWFLLMLPGPVMYRFLGQHLPATLLLVLGIILSLVVLFTALKAMLVPTVVSLAALIFVMIINRDLLRGFYYDGIYSPSALTVAGEYGSLVLFLISFAVGLLLIAYMISLVFKTR